MNNFLKRTLTAGAFVAVLLGCTYYSQLSFSILFLLITILGVWEFYKLSEKGSNKPQKFIGTIAGAILFISNAAVCMGYYDARILILNLPLLFLIFIF
ncbi:MAG TPA: phosphatidate cytidylyltransferase, partial [Bacteroidia bacterium]